MRGAVIAAGGLGLRVGASVGKQYLPLLGIPMLAHTIRAFQLSDCIDIIIVVVAEADVDFCRGEIAEKLGFDKVSTVVAGGVERQHSVAKGLAALPSDAEVIAVHDGARPLITPELIENCFAALPGWDGVVPALPVKETLKLIEGDAVVRTLTRNEIWGAQTPQVFRADVLREAHSRAERESFTGTDDALLVERMGGRVRIVSGDEENIKITTQVDLRVAEMILETRFKK